MDNLAAAYDRQVEQWVRVALNRGARSLDAVVAALPGVYPTIVLDVLQRLAPDRAWLVPSNAHSTGLVSEGQIPAVPPLPVPHPLDYDWRFHTNATAKLLRYIDTYAVSNTTVWFLGTPTAFHAALQTAHSYTPILLEANAAMIQWFATHAPTASTHHCMIGRDLLPAHTGSVVVADPPWYEESIRAFVWAAAQLCSPGGMVLLSMPPIGTRPGMAAESARIQAWAKRMGLEPVRRIRRSLPYETPPFERSALLAAGVPMSDRPWRRGDLVVFARRMHTIAPTLPGRGVEDSWEEVNVSGVRIRLRSTAAEPCDPRLIPLVPQDVLPSVSRRDPRRSLVDVWTTSNRVYACRSTNVLRALLRAYHTATPQETAKAVLGRPLTATESACVDMAHRQIRNLLIVEQGTLDRFGKDGGYEQSPRNTAYQPRRRRQW